MSADVIPGFAPATETSNVTPLPTVAVTTTTNENGVWVVDEHRFGSSTFTVSASNFATGTVDVDVSPGVNTNGDLTLIADPSTLSGRLELTTSDTTTSYTDFEATATATAAGLSEIETVTLEANGTYTIPITVQGTYDVTISRSDGNNTNFDGLPNNPIEVTTVPGGPTSVANITATELGTISVEVSPSNADVKLCTAVDQVCGDPVIPTAGTVQFTLPSAGNYFVQVSADGYETGTSPTREVGAGENVDLKLFSNHGGPSTEHSAGDEGRPVPIPRTLSWKTSQSQPPPPAKVTRTRQRRAPTAASLFQRPQTPTT